jgi:stage II sporulation protein D
MIIRLLFILNFITLSVCLLGYASVNATAEGFASWNINYGNLLVDEGKYFDALEAYDAAFDASEMSKTQGRALLQRAMVLSTYLDEPDSAADIYGKLIKEFPDFEESASYKLGLLLFESKRYQKAINVLSEYKKKYPSGKYIFQAEVLIEESQRALKPIVKPPPPLRISPQHIILPVIRVRLNKRSGAEIVQLKGKNLIAATIDDTKIKLGDNIKLTAENSKVISLDKHVFFGTYKIKISGDEFISLVIDNKKKKTLRGIIELKAVNNKLLIINHVDIESYLRSVVPAESCAAWHPESLKAQAVAARTYAYYQMQHRSQWDFDVTDDTYDQVYAGADVEKSSTDKAVKNTQGVVLTRGEHESPKPVYAMFTSNSGGYTADAETIFNLKNKPYLKAKPDAASIYGAINHWTSGWTKTKSISEIEKILTQRRISIGRLQDIRIIKKSKSGRILKIKIIGSKRSVEVKSKPLLTGGGLKLPEVLVTIRKQGNNFIFKGKGFGHGVGYSQWGGKYMADQGVIYSNILSFYYSGTSLSKLW